MSRDRHPRARRTDRLVLLVAGTAPVMSTRVTCDCTWTGTYPTPAKATYAASRHSCTKRRRELAATRRTYKRRAAKDRTPQPCTHKRADHQHGTYVCYVLDRCRCWPCDRAHTAYNATRTRALAYGTWNPYVDAQPAAAHVRALSAAGMGWKRAAHAAGVPESSVYPLLYGRPDRRGGQPRVKARRVLVDALLAVPMPTVADLGATVVVDGTGTRRRLEALIALGWSVNRLAADHGLDRQALDAALHWQPVSARIAQAVQVMFLTIGDRRPSEDTRAERQSASRSRNRAQANGWVIPGEWDDADLDDPYAPTPVVEPTCRQDGCDRTDLAAKGQCWGHYKGQRTDSRPVDLDEWAFLVRGGVRPDEAARRLGFTMSGVERRAQLDGRQDVARLIREVRAAA